MTGRRALRPDPIPPIIVGCRTVAAAAELAWSLRHDAGLTGITTDDRLVRVPWSGSEEFLRELFDRSERMGWVAPETAASAVRSRLRENARVGR